MEEQVYHTGIGGELADGLKSAARTSLGDDLRSVIYVTPEEFDVLYVRSDLYDDAEEVRQAKTDLVEFEQIGFEEVGRRTKIAKRLERSNIGRYEFTVRFHEYGFVVRALEGQSGVVLTVDRMDVRAFEEAVSAVKKLLQAS